VLLSGSQINIFEDGLESRDFVFIEDVVEANTLALEAEGAAFKTINVGTGITTTVLAVAQELMKAYGVAGKLSISGQFRLGDIRHNFADITRLKTCLRYVPKVGFTQGIGKFAAWVKAQGDKALAVQQRYQSSLSKMREKKLIF
jgi:dTDP-L-rhamnose 4-epimerase